MARALVMWTAPRHDRPDLFEMLEQAGCEVRRGNDYTDRAAKLSEDDLVAVVADVHGLMVGGRDRITRRVLEAAPRLVVVSKTGTGVDTIDLGAATELGILVTNTPVRAHRDAVVEHTLALLLAVTKRLLANDATVRTETGLLATNTLLSGKTAGIIGYGRIGRRVAEVLSVLGMSVVRFDPFVPPDGTVEAVDLAGLLGLADVVSLHATQSSAGQCLLDRQAIAAMKPSAVLINTARGALVDEIALAEAIRGGRLAGAGVDVFSIEPPATDHPLLAADIADRVVLSPHAAASVPEARHQVGTAQVQMHITALRGREPDAGIVNPAVLPRWRGRTRAPLRS